VSRRPRRRSSGLATRQLRRRWTIPALIIVLSVLIIADRQGWLLTARSDDYARYHGRSFVVTEVIDGDTIEVDVPDPVQNRPTTRVRLWGIDCPELAHAGNPQGGPWAEQARQRTRELALDASVTLELERSRLRGHYGRILAHVDLPDGRRLNAVLLRQGLARADDRWPHSQLSAYAAAEQTARTQQRGVWSADSHDSDLRNAQRD